MTFTATAFFVIIFCFAGVFHAIENQYNPEVQKEEGRLYLHDALYFVISTISSVGYIVCVCVCVCV